MEVIDENCGYHHLGLGGYPGDYLKGLEIHGLENVSGSLVYHSKSSQNPDKIINNGGRVLAITTIAEDFKKAIEVSKQNAEKSIGPENILEKDIGFGFL